MSSKTIGEVELVKELEGMLPGTKGTLSVQHAHGCLQPPRVCLMVEEGKVTDEWYDTYYPLPIFDLSGLLEGGFAKILGQGPAGRLLAEFLLKEKI